MINKAVLVYNPTSGDNNLSKEEVLERVHLHLEGFEIYDFDILGEDVTDRLKDFLTQIKPSLVIIAGGDGTVKLTTSCLPSRILLAILPLGSANGLAKCLGIGNMEDGLEALRKLETFQMDAILIGDELCLHLADFGFNASMIHKFEQGDSRGMLGYIKSSISEAFSTVSSRYRLEMPGESIELEAKMLVIANGEEYGTGAIINTEGSIDDGKFEIIAVEMKSPGDFISITKGLITGENQEKPAVRTWSVKSCKIYNLDHANFQIDGELRGNPALIEVKIKKGAFDFVRKS
ncbi:MAG TPA: diacylglycerol kinase family protein [Algoriphagus sp.]|nr:diacylglycerol kinase family protein [Algoriphagus sp.]